MERYDPLAAPDPADWLALDEGRRLHLVARYHRRARIRMPNPHLHAVLHVAVENQIARDDARIPVAATLRRLMAEGLDRHDALHAIASVMTEHILPILQGRGESGRFSERAYVAALERLTTEGWRRFCDEEG